MVHGQQNPNPLFSGPSSSRNPLRNTDRRWESMGAVFFLSTTYGNFLLCNRHRRSDESYLGGSCFCRVPRLPL